MIQEIFITDMACNVLCGNPKLFPSGGLKGLYPVESVGGKKLSKLRANDVVLSILYTGIDNFTASRFLLDLKGFIEKRISRLDSQSVQKNYFILLELLQNVELVFPGPVQHAPGLLQRENVYIDVMESVHTVIGEDGEVLQNRVEGEVLSDSAGLRIALERGRAEFRTVPEEARGGAEIFCESDPHTSFSIRDYTKVFFRMMRQGHIYTFTSDCKSRFRHIEVTIPVGRHSYSAKLQQSAGSSEFDMQSGVVRWRMAQQCFAKETIKIHATGLDGETDTRSIMIDFRIEDPQEANIKIKGCRTVAGSSHKFWVRYVVQSGHYELRQ